MELARKLSKAVQVFEGSDVAEDAEYGGGVEDDANAGRCPRQRGQGTLCRANESAGGAEDPECIRLHVKMPKAGRGEEQAEGRGKPTQMPRTMNRDESREGADHEGAPRRLQNAVTDQG